MYIYAYMYIYVYIHIYAYTSALAGNALAETSRPSFNGESSTPAPATSHGVTSTSHDVLLYV